MIQLIVGNKGSGKTKKLIELANEAVKNSGGNVVCVEKGLKLTYDISHKARLIDSDAYQISGIDAFYGFLSGILAGNYDITDVLIDATFKIVGRDYNAFGAMIRKLEALTKDSQINVIFTVSCDMGELPEDIKKFAI